MTKISDLEEGSSSKQINPRYVGRFAPPCLAGLFALVVVLFLFRAGETALLCTRLLFTLSAAVYVAARLLRQREEGWSWSGWAETWRATKDCAASVAGYCRLNYKRVTYYAVIFLYGSSLLFTDGGADNRYVVVVSLLVPALIAVVKVAQLSDDLGRGVRPERGGIHHLPRCHGSGDVQSEHMINGDVHTS